MSFPPLPEDMRTGAPSACAIELATLLCVAVRVEPQLIRAARLDLAPRLNVGAETDLWFSAWVATRSVDCIVLRPGVRAVLQDRLALRLAADSAGTDPARGAWELIERAHARSSPALLLEEHLAWLAAQPGTPDINGALQPALRAAVIEGRTGVTEWFIRAWQVLPEAVRNTTAAWQLAQIAKAQIQVTLPLISHLGDDLDIADVAILADALDDIHLSVRHDGRRLTVSPSNAALNTSVAVPDTDPRILEISWESADTLTSRILRINAGAVAQVEVGNSPVWIRTSRGTVHELLPPTTPIFGNMSSFGLFIAYSYDISAHDNMVSEFWRFLRDRGYAAFAGLPSERTSIGAAPARSAEVGRAAWIEEHIYQADVILLIGQRERSEQASLTECEELVLELLEHRSRQWSGRVLAVLLPGDSYEELPWFVGRHYIQVFPVADLSDFGAQSLLETLAELSNSRELSNRNQPPVYSPAPQEPIAHYAFRVMPVEGSQHASREGLADTTVLDMASSSFETQWNVDTPMTEILARDSPRVLNVDLYSSPVRLRRR